MWGFGCEANKVMAQQNILRVSWGAALSSLAAAGEALGGGVSVS